LKKKRINERNNKKKKKVGIKFWEREWEEKKTWEENLGK
jgi:cytidylate kinase